jgi:hypothetical protein
MALSGLLQVSSVLLAARFSQLPFDMALEGSKSRFGFRGEGK